MRRPPSPCVSTPRQPRLQRAAEDASPRPAPRHCHRLPACPRSSAPRQRLPLPLPALLLLPCSSVPRSCSCLVCALWQQPPSDGGTPDVWPAVSRCCRPSRPLSPSACCSRSRRPRLSSTATPVATPPTSSALPPSHLSPRLLALAPQPPPQPPVTTQPKHSSPRTPSSSFSRRIASETSLNLQSTFRSPRTHLTSSSHSSSSAFTFHAGRAGLLHPAPLMHPMNASRAHDSSAPPSPQSISSPSSPHLLPRSTQRHAEALRTLQRDDPLATAAAATTDSSLLSGGVSPVSTGQRSPLWHPPPPSRPLYSPSAVVQVTEDREERPPSSPATSVEGEDLPSLSSSSSFSLSALPSTPTFSRYSLQPSQAYAYPQLPRDDLSAVELDPRSPLPVWHPRLQMRGAGRREPL